MKDILSAVERAAKRRGMPEQVEIRDYCLSTRQSLRAYCNRMALSLAQGFHAGELSYAFCDESLNILFNFIMEPQFLDTAEGMPQPAFEIFQAFDTAEYYRGSEPPEVDPVEQYTRPRVAEILVRLAAA